MLVVVPFCCNKHWSASVLNLQGNTIKHFDSIGSSKRLEVQRRLTLCMVCVIIVYRRVSGKFPGCSGELLQVLNSREVSVK